jgi:hypothetical protein
MGDEAVIRDRPAVAGNVRRLGGISLLLGAFVALALAGHFPPIEALSFAIALSAAWVGYALFFLDRSSVTTSVLWLGIGAAIAARIAGLATPPIYEDDWARYLWDGYRFLQDGTPYAHAPALYVDDANVDPGWQSILQQVNNPDVPTIYAPALQYVFALASWFAPTSLAVLKVILIGFDLVLWVTVWRLAGTAAGLRYALCPLVIFEVSFNAHADIIGAALAVVCYALAHNGKKVAAGVAFGVALACKPFAVICAPALTTRHWPSIALGAAAALALLYVPFIRDGATELAGVQIFSKWWEFNSLGFAGLKAAFGDSAARPLALVIGVGLCGALMMSWRLREPNTVPPADKWLLALLALAPVINPWYLLWAAPWACLRPTALTWSVLPAVSVSYLTFGVLGHDQVHAFDHPAWVRPLEVALAAAIWVSLIKKAGVVRHRPSSSQARWRKRYAGGAKGSENCLL